MRINNIKNKELRDSQTLFRKYGITMEQYELMFDYQDGLCAICGQVETRRFKGSISRFAVDHNHKTGEVRGLLCSKCNVCLGYAQDDPKLLLKMINYLKK